ncbi:MAG: class I SAM-dependent methyltransferase [Xanthomonadales bacterium]|nr:class I SAM-dependent methyltransferase [Xanthomonadales bacterium]
MKHLAPTSQLLMRSLPLLQLSNSIVIINPPADLFCRELLDAGINNLSVLSSNYYIYQYIKENSKENTLNIEFTSKFITKGNNRADLAIVYLPKEKPFRDYLLSRSLGTLGPAGKVWLVGENRAGIKSAAKQLTKISASVVSKLDSARHCSLLETQFNNASRSALESQLQAHSKAQPGFNLHFNQKDWNFTTLPGVFSYAKLDPASRMLLKNLEEQPVSGHILDFACGSGVLGICASSLQPDIRLDLLDVSAMALASTEINLKQAGLAADTTQLLASDAYSEVKNRYSAIISNPPFHRDTRQTLEVSEALIHQAPLHLKAKGELRLVANRHLPYLALFEQAFRQVKILSSDRYFHVIQGKYPIIYRT